LITTNIIYFCLLFGRHSGNEEESGFKRKREIIGICLTLGLQFYAYMGILEQANVTSSKMNKKQLVGGQNLDWLGLSLVVQFGSTLHSAIWFWLLLLFPVLTLYSLHSTFAGAGVGKSQSPEDVDYNSTGDASNSTRREKRAEKRRKKWL
jgi:hypothetical protein